MKSGSANRILLAIVIPACRMADALRPVIIIYSGTIDRQRCLCITGADIKEYDDEQACK